MEHLAYYAVLHTVEEGLCIFLRHYRSNNCVQDHIAYRSVQCGVGDLCGVVLVTGAWEQPPGGRSFGHLIPRNSTKLSP
jgi:hypothetical protein